MSTIGAINVPGVIPGMSSQKLFISNNKSSQKSEDTEKKGALVDSDNATRIDFNINPESFQDNKSLNLSEINIPGMSHPRLQFANGSSRVLSFSLFLHYGATKDVPNAIKILQSWLYPEYENGKLTKTPPKLLLVFGDTWADEKWILRSCNITRQRFDKDLKCILAEISIELIEYIEDSKSSKDIKK